MGDPVGSRNSVPVRNSAKFGLRIVDIRASLLPADKVVEEAALDKYAYIPGCSPAASSQPDFRWPPAAAGGLIV